jgi:hypothetical protein
MVMMPTPGQFMRFSVWLILAYLVVSIQFRISAFPKTHVSMCKRAGPRLSIVTSKPEMKLLSLLYLSLPAQAACVASCDERRDDMDHTLEAE